MTWQLFHSFFRLGFGRVFFVLVEIFIKKIHFLFAETNICIIFTP